MDEGKFRMYYANGSGGLLQEGSFGESGLGDTMTKTYTLVEGKRKPFDMLEYSANNSFVPEPASGSLKCVVKFLLFLVPGNITRALDKLEQTG